MNALKVIWGVLTLVILDISWYGGVLYANDATKEASYEGDLKDACLG